MLENKPGVIQVDKLVEICLMGADFNFVNHLYFGKQMKVSAKKHKILLYDAFGGGEYISPAEVTLCILLFFDLVR